MLMPDDTVKRDLFSLIKSALTGTPQPLSKDFDLVSVLGTVRKHQIENIVYYGAAKTFRRCVFRALSERNANIRKRTDI